MFSRGRLASGKRKAVERHLDDCEACCSLVSELARIYATSDSDDLPSGDWPDQDDDDSFGRHDTLAEDQSGPVPVARLTPGARVGRYHILEVIGEGGMGVVYAAYDADLDRKVALKVLHERGPTDGRAQRRLLREAQAMARLSHPNVITVHEAGQAETRVFISMEFLDGGTLSRWLTTKEPALDRILAMFRDVGRGLAAAHAVGLVHRDVKPDNVLIGSDQRPRVTDFGLARLSEDDLSGVSDSRSDFTDPDNVPPLVRRLPLDATLTRTGALVGTPAYMAPEQFRREPTTPACDQFSFFVALHEALWGSRPFTGRTLSELAQNVMSQNVTEPTRDVSVPRWLRNVVWRGLSLEPEDRWPSMDVVVERLRAGPRRARRRLIVAGGMGLLLAGAGSLASGQLASTPDPCDRGEQVMDEIWPPNMRIEVQRALAQGSTAYAEDTANLAVQRIDDYAAQWTTSHRDACEDYHRGEQSDEALDLRGACLDQRRRELTALVDVLTTIDPDVRRHAIEAIDELQPVAPCEDVKALRARVPPPDDPSIRMQVDRIENDLVNVRARLHAGQYERGLVLSQEVSEAARLTGYGPLIARAQRVRASLYLRLGQDENALARLREAWQHALGAGDDALASECAVELVQILGHTLQRFDEADVRIEDARAMIDRVRRFDQAHAERLDGELDFSRGQVALRHNHLDEALSLFRRAQRVVERNEGADSLRMAVLLNSTASALLPQGNWKEALSHYRRVLEIRTKHLGASHPETALTHNNVGLALKQLHRLEEAAEHLERGQAYVRASLGPDHPSMGMLTANLGEVYFLLKRFGLAAENYRKAYGRLLPREIEHEYTLRRVVHYGTSVRRTGRNAEARRVLTMARDRAYALGMLEQSRLAIVELARVELADGHAQLTLDLLQPIFSSGAASPKVEGEVALVTGLARLDLGDVRGAKAVLPTIRASRIQPDSLLAEEVQAFELRLGVDSRTTNDGPPQASDGP